MQQPAGLCLAVAQFLSISGAEFYVVTLYVRAPHCLLDWGCIASGTKLCPIMLYSSILRGVRARNVNVKSSTVFADTANFLSN